MCGRLNESLRLLLLHLADDVVEAGHLTHELLLDGGWRGGCRLWVVPG